MRHEILPSFLAVTLLSALIQAPHVSKSDKATGMPDKNESKSKPETDLHTKKVWRRQTQRKHSEGRQHTRPDQRHIPI